MLWDHDHGEPLTLKPAVPDLPNPKAVHGRAKVPMGLVPPIAEIMMARAFYEGAFVKNYGPFNWRESGVDTMTYVHAIRRHLAAYLDGEDIDAASGKLRIPHLGKIMACCAILLDVTSLGKLEDNRPPPGTSPRMLMVEGAGKEDPTPYPFPEPTDKKEAAKEGHWFEQPEEAVEWAEEVKRREKAKEPGAKLQASVDASHEKVREGGLGGA